MGRAQPAADLDRLARPGTAHASPRSMNTTPAEYVTFEIHVLFPGESAWTPHRSGLNMGTLIRELSAIDPADHVHVFVAEVGRRGERRIIATARPAEGPEGRGLRLSKVS